MKISELINFDIQEDFIEAGGQRVYFFRFFPPNLNIMTENEKDTEVTKFRELYESLIDQKLQIISLDKTENLSENKNYWESLLKKDETGFRAEVKKTIINSIGSIESTSSSVGRAFYFVLKVKEKSELTRFETTMNVKNIHFYIAEKQELITVMRNFILREFINFDLYIFESEMEKNYEEAHGKKSA